LLIVVLLFIGAECLYISF